MVRIKVSLILFAIVMGLSVGFYMVLIHASKVDSKTLLSRQLSGNSAFVKEHLSKQNLFYETQIAQWAISNEIAETIVILNGDYTEQEEIKKEMKKLTEQLTSLEPKKGKTVDQTTQTEIDKLLLQIKEHQNEISKLSGEIDEKRETLRDKLVTFNRSLNANLAFFVATHLEQIDQIQKKFQFSANFVKKIEGGLPDSDIWSRNGFLYQVYGVPIKSGREIVASLYIGFKLTKQAAGKLSKSTLTPMAYIYNGEIRASNIESHPLQQQINQYLEKNLKAFEQYYRDGDSSPVLNIPGGQHLAMFIPIKNSEEKAAGALLIASVTSLKLEILSGIRYLLPTATLILFIAIFLTTSIITRNYIKPYTEIELGINQFLDGEDIYFNLEDMEEGESLARAINRLFNKITGKCHKKVGWDDPLFVTELNPDQIKTTQKPENYISSLFKAFISAHKRLDIPSEHITTEAFERRLARVETHLMEKHKVKEIIFEVAIDNGVVKLHPHMTENS